MDTGRNINPVWSPDGRTLAFVSDRTGISNIFLYEFDDGQIYQLTNLFTGVQGITPLSPVLTWSSLADRLAFVYYEDGQYSVYSLENPRSLRREPYQGPSHPPVVTLVTAAGRDSSVQTGSGQLTATSGGAAPGTGTTDSDGSTDGGAGSSIYRSSDGFRPSAQPQAAESSAVSAPLTVRALLDSATLALPDTSEFKLKPYRVRFTADYMVRPTVGYQRDNWGRGLFGGTAIALSDILGNHAVVLAGAVNGRISEAQFLGLYVNQSGRLNWAGGFSQDPMYFYGGSDWTRIENPQVPGDSVDVFTSRTRRFVIRDAFSEAYYPFDRFNRLEIGFHAVNISEATLAFQTLYDASTGNYVDQRLISGGGPSATYVQPTITHVHDNTLFGYVGPFAGARSRISIAPAIGSWHFTSGLVDVRRYIHARPLTLALRAMAFGRYGRVRTASRSFSGTPSYCAATPRARCAIRVQSESSVRYECPERINDRFKIAAAGRAAVSARPLARAWVPPGRVPADRRRDLLRRRHGME